MKKKLRQAFIKKSKIIQTMFQVCRVSRHKVEKLVKALNLGPHLAEYPMQNHINKTLLLELLVLYNTKLE